MNVAGYGEMVFELFEGRVPRATRQIIALAESGFYNGVSFHRIINDDELRKVIASDAFKNALANDAFRAALTNDAFRAALANDAFRSALSDKAFRSALTDDAFRAAMTNDASGYGFSCKSCGHPLKLIDGAPPRPPFRTLPERITCPSCKTTNDYVGRMVRVAGDGPGVTDGEGVA